MNLKFEKWHGAKNDFILVWLLGDQLVFDSLVRQAPQLCGRDGTGIGADGILVLHISQRDQIEPDGLSIINSDGSLAATCGNGIRCASQSILRRHRESSSREVPESFALPLSEGEAMVHCRYLGRGHLGRGDHWPLVSVDMGIPKLGADCESFDQAKAEVERVAKELQVPQLSRDWGLVDIGNQHLVFFLDEGDRELLLQVGPAFQQSKAWDGINVHLALAKMADNKTKADAANRLGETIDELYEVYVWERGAGETMACGSGACAVAALALDSGLVDRSRWLGIQMPGGLLFCRQDESQGQVSLAGPAEPVFEGTVEI